MDVEREERERERMWRFRRELELEMYEGGIEEGSRVQMNINDGSPVSIVTGIGVVIVIDFCC